nr:PREDICTED: uncharacterized protein LOC108210168 isoform X3 [Daucus carota subsp. sativus]
MLFLGFKWKRRRQNVETNKENIKPSEEGNPSTGSVLNICPQNGDAAVYIKMKKPNTAIRDANTALEVVHSLLNVLTL